MKHRQTATVLVLVSILMLAACASDDPYETSATFDPVAIFPAEAIYAWNLSANRLPENPQVRSQFPNLDRRIKLTADEAFARRGYRVVSNEVPNYWLSYDMHVHTFISGENSRATATLSLTLVDEVTRRRVWLGFVRAEVLAGSTDEEGLERMRGVMASILQNFPPNQRDGAN
jgi:hypothetical protein